MNKASIAVMPAHLLGFLRIVTGLLFFQHGAEKLWGFAGGHIDRNFATLHGFAGPLEVIGGTLIVVGLFTRAAAFILCGQMAVAYFVTWAPFAFLPVQNGGEEAVQFCFLYLWLVTAGGGAWSLDTWLRGRKASGSLVQTLSTFEPHSRSLLRIVFGFLLFLRGLRLTFSVLPPRAGRSLGMPTPLDSLPAIAGYWAIVGGALLIAGLLSRPAALLSCVTAIAAYLYAAVPRGLWPIRNGGNETLLYALVFLYIGVAGAGAWQLDRVFSTARSNARQRVASAA